MIKIADPIIKDEEISAVVDVLKSGQLARGKKVAEFEKRFAEMIGPEYKAIATNSGTAALHAALRSCGIREDDEVIVPAFSFFSTASMINVGGAIPVFVDVKYDGTIDVSKIEDEITEKTKAVIGVNLYGKRIQDIKSLEEVCSDYNLWLIIDSCQSPVEFGGRYGDVSCFSFYATKNITTGEGGMIVTKNETICKNASSCIDHGQWGKYNHTHIGFNYRMTDIAAAVGVEQLKRLNSVNKRRREIAQIYNSLLVTPPLNQRYMKPEIVDDHVFHQYVIRHEKRDYLKEFLRENEIETSIHYPRIIPHQPVYRKYYKGEDFPISTNLSNTVLSLPCHPNLTDDDITFVCEKVNEFCVRSKI